jgi:predicted DNA-binding transcriptional regulator AlpA
MPGGYMTTATHPAHSTGAARPLLTLTETCELLRLSTASIYRLTDLERLQRVKIGRAARWTAASVYTLIADLEAGLPLVIQESTPAQRRQNAARQAQRRAQQRLSGSRPTGGDAA